MSALSNARRNALLNWTFSRKRASDKALTSFGLKNQTVTATIRRMERHTAAAISVAGS
jgi:hypothetical protein